MSANALVPACADQSPLLEVPSRMAEAPAARSGEVVDSARAAARRVIRADKLPGVSVAVGRNAEVVWAEAFG